MREIGVPLASAPQPATKPDRAQWITELKGYPPLAQETRTHVTTEHAAYLLGRRPQTMRCWAMRQHPIRAVNVNGRLAWPVSEIKRLMGLA